MDPYSYTELVTICLSLKALLRKSLTGKLLGMERRAFNFLERQELHLASLWVQMGTCATSMPLFSVSKKGKCFLICKLRANRLEIPNHFKPRDLHVKIFLIPSLPPVHGSCIFSVWLIEKKSYSEFSKAFNQTTIASMYT